MKNRSNYVEEIKSSKKLKNNILYISILFLWFLTVSVIQTGGIIVFFLTLVVSVVTYVTSLLLPNERENVLKHWKIGVSGYLLSMLLVYSIIYLAASQSIEIGILNNMYYITMIFVPISLSGLQVKKIAYLFGIGKTKRETIEYYQEHGNDGRR